MIFLRWVTWFLLYCSVLHGDRKVVHSETHWKNPRLGGRAGGVDIVRRMSPLMFRHNVPSADILSRTLTDAILQIWPHVCSQCLVTGRWNPATLVHSSRLNYSLPSIRQRSISFKIWRRINWQNFTSVSENIRASIFRIIKFFSNFLLNYFNINCALSSAVSIFLVWWSTILRKYEWNVIK